MGNSVRVSSQCRHLFRYVTNQPPKANSAFHPSGVGKWVPASAGKAKAGMVHSISGWMWGVQVKLWDPLRTRGIPQHLRGVFTIRRYTNPRLLLPYLTCWTCLILVNMVLFVSRHYRVWAAVMCLKPICKVLLLKGLQVSIVFVKFNMKRLVRTASGTLNWQHGIVYYHYCLIEAIEAIQRRAVRVIYPVTTSLPYWVASQYAELPSLSDGRDKLCRDFFRVRLIAFFICCYPLVTLKLRFGLEEQPRFLDTVTVLTATDLSFITLS